MKLNSNADSNNGGHETVGFFVIRHYGAAIRCPFRNVILNMKRLKQSIILLSLFIWSKVDTVSSIW
ncbi:hypothetical protein HMPREF9103_03086 [Lentilactobacillus parafarraginis F0439]|uniref:Uncharacterized protein n=1 Tax=Lentilactobacillus parafarraginis F0439 TaxID=797515 RepID=G9ZTK1_9LACO|nr:hypothetical protein HMPREF9103_03086 [Lentilactobacillus parafarraginis F0439]